LAKAAILEAPGEGLRIAEVTFADPGPHEVLIDTKACGLCHSDLHFIDGHYPHALPCIPGHEAAGIVRAVGSEVRTVKPGDHVVSCLSAFCGHCEFCVTGRMALCLGGDTRRAKGDSSRIAFADGSPVNQMLNLSALSEQMLIHEHACVSIDKDMPFDRAALLGCAVTTGAGTIFNACKVTPGETVLVVGCGGVGLAVINAAKIAGAAKIIAADPLPIPSHHASEVRLAVRVKGCGKSAPASWVIRVARQTPFGARSHRGRYGRPVQCPRVDRWRSSVTAILEE